MIDGLAHEDRWHPWGGQPVLTGGPERIYDEAPKPEWRTHVGFVRPSNNDTEPLLWDGDNA